ncbi:hypothetical protein AN958_08523 [Leucoagaricus sp. SymC.cos]|nr:hypothetical protein AN958_08523 [Leucoagaricus sp. SymC.cos]
MIQQTNRESRRPPASPGPSTQQDPDADGPEIWGKWAGQKHYSLEVVQHPLRARMCGFGDKDRRPLAPAAVVKMVVRTQDDKVVDVDDIDWSFFLVLVDLWSADGKQEMNLVLHPSSADRYMPIPSSKNNRRRGTSINQTQQSHSGQQTPIQPSPAPSYRPPEPTPPTPLPTYTAHHPTYFSPATTATGPPPTEAHTSYGPPPPPPQEQTPSWGYSATNVDRSTTYPPPILPSITTFVSASSSTTTTQSNWPDTGAVGSNNTNFGNNPGSNGNSDKNSTPSAPVTTSYPPMPSPRSTYTRTLVGPLSANACRLQDEHRKPGIFFLFQDLSVRTEGTFRLRMRLMNVGAPPAPEYGATKVHTDISPVLAQTFTDPFTVFSAKRFPGVPDTTALSIAFGNQGQKIPLVSTPSRPTRPAPPPFSFLHFFILHSTTFNKPQHVRHTTKTPITIFSFHPYLPPNHPFSLSYHLPVLSSFRKGKEASPLFSLRYF